MKKELNFGKIKWIHLAAPEKNEIKTLIKKYDFHELIEEDLMEFSTQEKIDVYEDYMFIVINFPKYNLNIKKYLLNEFSIIMGKNVIVTMTRFETNHIKQIMDEYAEELEEREKDEDFKISTYYILYKILDVMYDKGLEVLIKSAKDVVQIEEQLFTTKTPRKQFLESLMIKRRNIAFLKHTFIPHKDILQDLTNVIPKFYKEDLDVYFEDISSKLDKIVNNIDVSLENVNSLSDTYNTLMSIRTNSIINVLTIFSVITGVLTLISGIYGMNIQLPGSGNSYMFYGIMTTMVVVIGVLIFLFRKQKRI